MVSRHRVHSRYIFIDNTKQHSGLGTIFLKHIKQELHIRSISAIMLDTDRSTPAENFYTKNGFEALEESVLMVSSTTDV
ncbi:GNAT family N-acetyltransferase [Lactococcus lactis]|nr:GNAT family N-acetyltransferase [Lactococcus lactis]